MKEPISILNLTLPLKIANYAKRFVGRSYRRRPKSRRMDCSSFTQMIFAQYGIKLHRVAREQARQGIIVDRKNLRVGDLLFFYVPGRYPSRNIVGHVAIYVGDNQMVHCIPRSQIVIRSIDKPHWKKTYLFAKRVIK